MRATVNHLFATLDKNAGKRPIVVLFATLCVVTSLAGCATVDATVDKVKSGVSERFNKGEKVEPDGQVPQAGSQADDSEPVEAMKKPILVDVQEKLRTLGYYSGPISGKLDSRTEAAIQDFQLDKDLRIDGRPTDALVQQLDKAIDQS